MNYNTDPDTPTVSLTIRGTLHIVYLNGRNGRFPVGTLVCPIGQFSIRDAWLENFEAGEYDGIFNIVELSLYTYRAYGETRTAIRIIVESYNLNDCDTEPEYAPNPPDEQQHELQTALQQENTAVIADVQPEEDGYDDGDSAAYTELLMSFTPGDFRWEIGDDYRIDSTIGRSNIRRCREALQKLGYSFDPVRQIFTMQVQGDVL